MTVRELIEHLQTLPPDLDVIYRFCSDYSVLEAGDIDLQTSSDPLTRFTAVKHHNMPGEYRAYYPIEKEDPKPTPANVVIFPGN